jgi:hypothetical protein
MELTKSELRDYAVVGARAHLEKLDAERATILTTFPELRPHGGASVGAAITGKRRGRPSSGETKRMAARALAADIANDGQTTRTIQRRRKKTAAERKAISEHMRKYWAARRGQK